VKTGSREQNSDPSDIGEVWTEVLPHESAVRFPPVSAIPPIPPILLSSLKLPISEGQMSKSGGPPTNREISRKKITLICLLSVKLYFHE